MAVPQSIELSKNAGGGKDGRGRPRRSLPAGPFQLRSFFSRRMSSPKKGSTRYSPSRREAVWGP